MQIALSPQRRDGELVLSRSGDVLVINGESFDFTALPDGASIPEGIVPCPLISGAVERVAGQVRLTLILPHGPNPPASVAFPQPLINPADGAIALPTEEEI